MSAGTAAPPQQHLLCLPGPENWYNYDGDFRVHGQPIKLVQEGGQGRGTGWCVWDGAVVLARYMEAASQADSQNTDGRCSDVVMHAPTQCIELGAGTGLAGLAAAQTFQVPTVLTDIAEVQAALQHNIDLNPHLSSLMSAQVLDWHSPLTVIQHIIESDGGHTRLHQSGCKELENTYLPSNSSPSEHDGQCVHSQGKKPNRLQSSQCENSSCLAQDAFQVPGSYQRRLQQLEQGNEGCSEIRQGQKAGHSRKLLVLAADCVWVEDLVHPFVRALKAVCSLCDNSLVLFAHKERSRKVDKVMITALQEDFTIESVPVLSGERRGSIRIMQLCLKCRRNTVAGI